MVAVLVLMTIAAFLALDYFVRRREASGELHLVRPGHLSPELAHAPAGAFLAPGHTWLRLEREGTARLGAAHLPLWALGRVESVDLCAPGSEIHAGDTLVTLRRGNRDVQLRSPVDGVVEQVNSTLQTDPDRVRSDPYDAGWLYTIRPRNLAAAIKQSFVAESAEAWLRDELRRLRDFVSSLATRGQEGTALADGGVPNQGFAVDLDARAWKAVTERFFERPVA